MVEDEKSVVPNETCVNLSPESLNNSILDNQAANNVMTDLLDPEAGFNNQENIQDKSSTNTCKKYTSNVLPVNSTNTSWWERMDILTRKFRLISRGNGEGQQVTTSRLNALSTCTALACLVLLCLYIVRGQATDLSPSRPPDDKFYRNAHINIPIPLYPTFEAGDGYTWKSVEQLLRSHSDKNRLHIKVVNENNNKQQKQSNIHFETYNHTLKISGRPNYCTMSDSNTPKNVVAPHTTHLHLSEMEGCHHYLKLILTQWKFPKVHHIKFHKMLIREQEFRALTKFIDRHNQTLHKVEIDECFLCPSPICDAGFINFPDHDFQITITRRRESPEWI